MDNYVQILIDGLKEKEEIVTKLTEYSEEQAKTLGSENFSFEEFDALVDKKDELIQKMIKLDEGFEVTYEHVKEELEKRKDSYKNEIGTLKNLVTSVTEKSVSLEALEARNRAALDRFFNSERKRLRENRNTSQAAYSYAKNMSMGGHLGNSLMDRKK